MINLQKYRIYKKFYCYTSVVILMQQYGLLDIPDLIFLF